MKKLLMGIALLFLAGCGGSDDNTRDLTPNLPIDTAPMVDSRQFLMTAYQDGLSEIQLSQLALQKSANSEVKAFAQTMITQHTEMNGEFAQLAKSKNVALPNDPSDAQKQLASQLSALAVEAFDRAYMVANVTMHDKDVAAAKLQARDGTDADVRRLAEIGLPTLQLHLLSATQIDSVLDPAAFLALSYQDGLAEIQLAQRALQRASSDSVRTFARRMIDDHTTANNRIAALAAQKGVALPGGPTLTQRVTLEEFSRFFGADFDKAYMDKNVMMHDQDVQLMTLQSARGRDADVVTLAQQTVPVLREHLSLAQSIDASITPSFLYSAFQDGNAEMQLGHLALLQGSASAVKVFGQRMIDDHSAANQRIRDLAQARDRALPTETTPEQMADYAALQGLSGAAFDLQYMAVNVRSHGQAVAQATDQSQNAVDTGIRAFAVGILPILNEHLAQAQAILQNLGSAT
ncbi:MAG: DUF4142 domain-containing protein [Burkholderiaceae bacterium]